MDHWKNLTEAPAEEPLLDRLWRQVDEGLDTERLLPTREKRTRDLAKKLDRELDRNGWRIFVSGAAYSIRNGKASQKKGAEAMLVQTVTRWRAEVAELLPHRMEDFQRIIEAGVARPEPTPRDRNR